MGHRKLDHRQLEDLSLVAEHAYATGGLCMFVAGQLRIFVSKQILTSKLHQTAGFVMPVGRKACMVAEAALDEEASQQERNKYQESAQPAIGPVMVADPPDEKLG